MIKEKYFIFEKKILSFEKRLNEFNLDTITICFIWFRIWLIINIIQADNINLKQIDLTQAIDA